jgi:type II secretory pathway pseudopilin PulG
VILASKNNRRSSSQSAKTLAAFTLVENLVSMAILGLSMLSLCGAFSFGFRLIRVTQENVRADQILVEKLETIRVYDWSHVTNSSFIPTNFTAQFLPTGPANGATYTGAVAIVRPAMTESYSNTVRQVTISVTWASAGLNRTRSMTTFVAQNGIQTYKP